MQVLKFPRAGETPNITIHPIGEYDREKDFAIIHGLPSRSSIKEMKERFSQTLPSDSPFRFLLELHGRTYLDTDENRDNEAFKYRLGVIAARIAINEQIITQTRTATVDEPSLYLRSIESFDWSSAQLSRFALRSFYESNDPANINGSLRSEVGHIISPTPQSQNDWFAVGMGDAHAAISYMLAENLTPKTEPLDVGDPVLVGAAHIHLPQSPTTSYEDL